MAPPRLALGELTNQLQSTKLALDKWATETTQQASSARQKHLDKLAASQREHCAGMSAFCQSCCFELCADGSQPA